MPPFTLDALNLEQVDVYAYQLPLIRPMHMLGRQMSHREGTLLRLQDSSGHFAWGEVAPFPGLQTESVIAARGQLLEIKDQLKGQSFHPAEILTGTIPAFTNVLASVRWGIQMALLNLLAVSSGKIPSELLCPAPSQKIQLNALLSGSSEEILKEARQLYLEGYRAFKLKVGRSPITTEIQLVKGLRDCLGPDCLLRLDANQAWSLKQALEFGKGLADCDIDYLEEPVADRLEMVQFQAETGISLAIDESLTPADLKAIQENQPIFPGLKAVILRPALLGTWQNILASVAKPSGTGIQLILSNAFESGVTLAFMAGLAACLPPAAMGLDTYRWLQQDLLTHRISVPGGRLDVHKAHELSQSVNRSRLQQL